MTFKELKQCFLKTDDGLFSPITKIDDEGNIIIVKTAEEVYQNWLNNKNKVIKPIPTNEEKIDQLEQMIIALTMSDDI